MSSPSNLYAEKVYAEQPIALWALDDAADFVSLFSTNGLSLSSWTESGSVSVTDVAEITNTYPQIVSANFAEATLTGSGILTSTETISTSSNFSAGIWINPKQSITSVTFAVGSLSKEFILTGKYDTWIYLNHNFEVSSPISSQSFEISFTYSGTETAHVFLNGFSLGIGQNLFGTKSVGCQLSSAVNGLYGVTAFEYGLGQNQGWYIGNNTSKKLYAVNSSVPLVYGANASTKLIENPNGPSVILPGIGFLNQSGKSQTLVFEAWLRIRTDGNTDTDPFRIFGPTASSDGLYVHGQHLVLKVGNEFASHYVGEWFRPMLINIEYSKDTISMMVNGEVVLKIETDTSNFPTASNGYLGFYVGGNVDFIELDCVAIYPYKVSPVLAKRRFGYGQAVEVPSEIEKAYSGQQISIDYTFANYSFDYQYPSLEKWNSSVSENIYSNKNTMGSPRLTKASVVLSDTMTDNGDLSKWESDLAAANTAASDTYSFIKLVPNSTWESNNINGFLYLKRLKQPGFPTTRSLYVVAEANSSYADRDQVILKLQDRETLDSVYVILSGNSIDYRYNISGSEGTFATKTISPGSKFTVGFDFLTTGTNKTLVRRFFASRDRLELYIGGDYSGSDNSISTTFMGKIYKFGTNSNTNHIKQGFLPYFSSGILSASATANIMSKTGTYEFSFQKTKFNDDYVYHLATSSSSYWQDYLSLNKVAKTTYASDGSELYLTDMIQFSIDAEASSSILDGKVDSSNNQIKTYVYFTYAGTYPTMLNSFGPSTMDTVLLPKNQVIDARTTWLNKKFEVVDGAIILVPQSGFITGKTQSDIVMVTIVEIVSKSTEKLPVKIRSLQYAAQTFDRRTSTVFDDTHAKKIGTRSGKTDIYMYSQSGSTYDYSSYNPIRINKNMSPYLYLTNKSGIKVLDSYSTSNDRGIYVPVNKGAAPLYKVSLISMYMLFNDASFDGEITVAEIYDIKYGKLKLSLEPTSNNQVAKILIKYLNSGSWVQLDTVEFYVNGTYSTFPTVTVGEWSNIGILFPLAPLDFSNSSQSRIEITGSLVINNISYYQLRPEELAQQVIPNEWNDYDNGDNKWQDYDTEKTWSVIAASEQFVRPELSPPTVYNIYSGTNRILATADNDLTGLTFGNYKYDVIEDIVWQNSVTVTP